MIYYVDAHCHPASFPDPSAYVKMRLAADCSAIAAASANPSDWDVILQLAADFPQIRPGIGIHPWAAADLSLDELRDALARLDAILAQHPEIRFIGECGLDALRPNMELQKYAFEEQIALAKKYKCLLVVHCCKMWHEMPRFMMSYSNVLFHGFYGSRELQLDIVKRSGYVSLGRAMLRSPTANIIPELIPRAVIETDDDAQHPRIKLSDVISRIENYNVQVGNELANALFDIL